MDRWKFYDITHRDHLICNPTSVAKLDELIGLLDLGPKPRALDIASGKGEFIVRVAERFGGPSGAGFRGVAVDISPYCTAWRAAARYAEAHPRDPDVAELLARVEHSRREYLNWGRDTLGWALYVFETRRAGSPPARQAGSPPARQAGSPPARQAVRVRTAAR
jgi:SAM-dependent methyltransferase